jgi:hypothetical protein
MKTSVTLIAIFLIFACPAPGRADYVIRLKNGEQMPAEYYWEEGNRIIVQMADGVMGIPKDTIAEIEESESTPKKVVIPVDTPVDQPLQDNTAPPEKKKELAASVSSEKRQEADGLLAEFQPLKARFKKIRTMRTSELYDLAKDNARFRRRVFKSKAVTLLNDMLIESLAMDDEIEALVKSRSKASPWTTRSRRL